MPLSYFHPIKGATSPTLYLNWHVNWFLIKWLSYDESLILFEWICISITVTKTTSLHSVGTYQHIHTYQINLYNNPYRTDYLSSSYPNK